jgi:parvulin-like peptidyl-prolyl isomerase
MRRTIFGLALSLLASAAHGQGFFLGGAADGAATARQLDLQRRALDLDRIYGTDAYEELRRDQQIRDLKRAIDENNRMLRDERARRGLLIPPLN